MSEERDLLERFANADWHYGNILDLKEEARRILSTPSEHVMTGVWKAGNIVGWVKKLGKEMTLPETQRQAYLRGYEQAKKDLNYELVGELKMLGNQNTIGAPYIGVQWESGMSPPVGTKLYRAMRQE